ncbi:putative bifunctional diguanylate cyclase/phosphodiesterase [Actinoplanes sp. CA-030573]|uniref:putative bifunctional diguanylate cyclase/phosphodiesterase n=1 Tax=Actinoplanes sp. CA-030573 TaxID=3239898 RepID=UPI003D8E5ED7
MHSPDSSPSHHWSTLQLTEFCAVLTGSNDEADVLQLAAERASEALEAEIAAVVIDGEVRAHWGVTDEVAASEALLGIGSARSVQLPGLGEIHAFAARLGRGTRDFLLVGRLDVALAGPERQTVQAMAQLLSLILRNLRALTAERTLRVQEQVLLRDKEREAAERLRLLEEVRTRQRLLEQLLTIQRAVSARHPLAQVLDAVTSGAAELLNHRPVVLVLAETSAQGLTIVSGDDSRALPDHEAVLQVAGQAIATGSHTSADAIVDTPAGRMRLTAAPVSVGREIAGSLVAVLDDDAGTEQRELLVAFAQQAGLALTDARTVEAVTQAQHDPVTGLPNRTLFLERLREAMAERRDDIVLFIDLDRFKAVNDSLGHRAGDALLAAVSRRIGQSLRSTDMAARIGGDEFAVLLRDITLTGAVAVAEGLIGSLRRPFRIASRDALIGASVGVAFRQSADDTAEDLLSNADVAMYIAKKHGASQAVVFEPQMLAETVARLDLVSDLQRALHQGDLRLHYQPLMDLRTLQPVGVEALMRWTCPRRGVVPPAEFIEIAEESDLIVDMGLWALREGVRQLARWRRDFPALRLNLNIAARQLLDRDFVSHVTDTLLIEGVPATALTLELTETAMIRDPERAGHQITRLKELGVKVALDDFGTGYSSLSYLRRFPVDELKIDRSFISAMNRSDEDLSVVRAVIDLADALRLQTVAEGIEDETQLATLRRLGCRLGQGYHLGRPLPPNEATNRLHAARPPQPAALPPRPR